MNLTIQIQTIYLLIQNKTTFNTILSFFFSFYQITIDSIIIKLKIRKCDNTVLDFPVFVCQLHVFGIEKLLTIEFWKTA